MDESEYWAYAEREMFAACMLVDPYPFDDVQGYSVEDEHGRPLFGRHVPGCVPERVIMYGVRA